MVALEETTHGQPLHHPIIILRPSSSDERLARTAVVVRITLTEEVVVEVTIPDRTHTITTTIIITIATDTITIKNPGTPVAREDLTTITIRTRRIGRRLHRNSKNSKKRILVPTAAAAAVAAAVGAWTNKKAMLPRTWPDPS